LLTLQIQDNNVRRNGTMMSYFNPGKSDPFVALDCELFALDSSRNIGVIESLSAYTGRKIA
jgi:hypothetical protein